MTTSEMTVYDAVKQGMDAYPDVELHAGIVYSRPNDDGDTKGQPRACAIGFMALSQCSPDEWGDVLDDINSQDNYLTTLAISSIMYGVIDHEQRYLVYNWNDDYISDHVHYEFTREDYLEALKESEVGQLTMAVHSCDVIDRTTLGPNGTTYRENKV